MIDWGNLEGLIPILGGTYAILLAKGILPRNPKDRERMEPWRRKFGGMIMVLGPVVIIFGVLQVFGLFR